MDSDDLSVIAAAFPRSPQGYPICSHCGRRRPGYYMLCVPCWDALSPFVKIEIVRGRTRAAKARLILVSKP